MPAMQVGPHAITPKVILAPMAGVTDKPFRVLCKQLGAGLCVSEMTTSDPRFWKTAKSLHRMDHDGEPAPISVQIAGTIPEVMADAARHNVDHGAQIIDINMGCPAKKVCNAWAGSALMRDEGLVARILEAVVGAVDVPVTLKIRTGWAADRRNAPTIARIAQDSGIAALAAHVLAATGCDAVMIGRAAQGRPWIFREVAHYLATGELLAPPSLVEVRDVLIGHLQALHAFYGEPSGVRIARKHLGWYAKDRPENHAFRHVVNRAETAEMQLALTRDYFDALIAGVPPALPVAA